MNKYKTLTANNPIDFDDLCNAYSAEEWTPLGEVNIAFNDTGKICWFTQQWFKNFPEPLGIEFTEVK